MIENGVLNNIGVLGCHALIMVTSKNPAINAGGPVSMGAMAENVTLSQTVNAKKSGAT
ncbi:hypothetical protein WBP06_00565 [Novosphingobium sp. BL-8H]|uniref:hypothetical protein n=1 Tax=Novosphingobium sp. BL-8H TaxID=3127640 RepID=UPI003756747E